MSLDRRLSVLPSVMISVRELGTPAPMVKLLPGAPAALIESIPGKVYDMEGVHDRPCVWEFFSGCAFEPGESIHRDDLDELAPGVGLGGQPGFEDPLGAARDHVQEPGGTAAVMDGRHVQDDVNEFVAVGGVAPHVSTLWVLVTAQPRPRHIR